MQKNAKHTRGTLCTEPYEGPSQTSTTQTRPPKSHRIYKKKLRQNRFLPSFLSGSAYLSLPAEILEPLHCFNVRTGNHSFARNSGQKSFLSARPCLLPTTLTFQTPLLRALTKRSLCSTRNLQHQNNRLKKHDSSILTHSPAQKRFNKISPQDS